MKAKPCEADLFDQSVQIESGERVEQIKRHSLSLGKVKYHWRHYQ